MPEIFLQIECDEHKGDMPCRVYGVGPYFETVEDATPLLDRIAAVIQQMPDGTEEVTQLDGAHDGG